MRWLGLWALLVLTAWPALRPGDVAVAEQMWRDVAIDKGRDFTEAVYVPVAAAQHAVAPWQPGWVQARERIDAVGVGRRSALAHDRGGIRRKAPLAGAED